MYNKGKPESLIYLLIVIILNALIHSYLLPSTNRYFVKLKNHWKYYYPLVTGWADRTTDFVNESEKATFHQLQLC